MQYNREITISTGESRTSVSWKRQKFWLSDFYQMLQTPARGVETRAEYLRLSKAEQDNLKDVGGFVGGTLSGPRRKANTVTGRDLVTLDMDQIPPGGTDDILRRVSGLGCGYCVYSTRKHAPDGPRLRIVIPLDRTALPDEYEPVARKLAELIQPEMSWFDPTTFEASRLMYRPSVCSDGEYVYQTGDKPFLSVDGMLAKYKDWRDHTLWPRVPGAVPVTKLAAKQGDPTEKTGVVGAFCRVYDVYAAMDKFLPGVYEKCDTGEDRYTFTGGSTTGGAIVYDGGKFLYSHHATDPCSGKLVNAFDLVRLHLFGGQDDEAKPGTPVNKLPSTKLMRELALADEPVSELMEREQYEAAIEEFGALRAEAGTGLSLEAVKGLAKRDKNPQTGKFDRSVKNVLLQMSYDPCLSGRIRKDDFAERLVGLAPLPWEPRRSAEGLFEWTDEDDAGLRGYIERQLGFRSKDVIDDALIQAALANRFNPVTDYMDSLRWDGQARLDSLFIDYLGAEDCEYTRTVARKMFVAAVARAHVPGTKFDYMAVFCGPQGIGKSTLIFKMALRWFTDSIKTFQNKDASELLQGCLIVEFSELEAFDRSDVNAAKSFITRLQDHYRAAYGRRTEKHARRCVFFGTTNDHSYLKDPTGNRRFLPVDCLVQPRTKNVFSEMPQEVIDQLWAEAVHYWYNGEQLWLSDAMEAEAEKRRERHFEEDPWQGVIMEFLSRPIPKDWNSWNAQRRGMFWDQNMQGDIETVRRDKVCALEIWRECFNQRSPLSQRESRRINRILERLNGWEQKKVRFGKEYGAQRGFVRCDT